jgi:hypothetical protein
VNDVFFGCMTCRVRVDAGYRWAWATLEAPGIVARGASVDLDRVLATPEYWSPPDEPNSRWLTDDILPRVETFLHTHRGHSLCFGDLEQIAGTDELVFLDWLDLSAEPDVGPRYFVEVLNLSRWADAVDWVRTAPNPPWWWSETHLVDAARRRFEALASSSNS